MTTIRTASESEIGPLFLLYEELFREHIERIWGWKEDWQSRNFKTEWSNCCNEIVEVDGNSAGFLQTQCRADPAHLFVLSLGIRPAFQRKGIGGEVMNLLKQRAVRMNLPIRLNVFRTNPSAERFYIALGFEKNERTDSGVILSWDQTIAKE